MLSYEIGMMGIEPTQYGLKVRCTNPLCYMPVILFFHLLIICCFCFFSLFVDNFKLFVVFKVINMVFILTICYYAFYKRVLL